MNRKLQHYYELILRNWLENGSRAYSSDPDFWEELARNSIRSAADDPASADGFGKRVTSAAGFLRAHGLLQKDQTVLDIGCGAGYFTVEFARTAGQVTGMDISPSLCAEAKRKAGALGLSNVEIVNRDFYSFDPDKEGALGKYDLVVASLLPGSNTVEGFRKIQALSRGSCFAAYLIETKCPLYEEAAALAAGEDLRKPSGRIMHFLFPFNILCLEGFLPEVTFFEETVTHIAPVCETDLSTVKRLWPNHDFSEEEKQKILLTLRDRADPDGNLRASFTNRIGCMLWKVEKDPADQKGNLN